MSQPDNVLRRLQLLLVEDNPGDVYLIRRALDDQGLAYDLALAGDGEEAIAWIQECESTARALDLVLLDLNLPRLGGSEVLARLRNSSTLANVPTLLLTSSDSAQDRERCLRLGANGYVRKPSNLADFMRIGKTVRELIWGRDSSGKLVD
jgi:CheY-like chemotaxis protein